MLPPTQYTAIPVIPTCFPKTFIKSKPKNNITIVIITVAIIEARIAEGKLNRFTIDFLLPD
ncbi:MAG: hypothetical protein Tsb0015_00330 [Simkaniaceae bacterium]